MIIRNERVLYRRPCKGLGHNEEVISIYSADKPFNVYDQKLWWSDEWDSLQFGKTYDFSRPFFEQFKELWETVPLLALSNSNAINSDYCNVADQSKDSYMTSGSFKIENTHYSNRVYTVKDSMDLYVGFRNELCYECVHCSDCYRVVYGKQCIGCTDSYFLYDCRNCSNCFGCTNLRNKNHCIFNKQYTKEDYLKKISEFNLGSAKQIEKLSKEFNNVYFKSIHKYATILKSVNVIGDNVSDAKNCKVCFDITEGGEDCKYVHWGGLQTKDVYDGGPGVGIIDLSYEIVDTGLQGSNIAFTNVVYGSHNVRYALFCHNSSNIFGCIGLRNKNYCILNKQYSKEEYEELIPRVIKHMNHMPYIDERDRQYRYGEFFPPSISPFCYNESIAQDYFPLTREKALERGYKWRELDERHYKTTKKAVDLPDNIKEVTDEILKEIIECVHKGECNDGCTIAFKIMPAELQFYQRLNLPLPRFCFNCRHVRRLQERNPLKLWHRGCMCDYEVYPNTRRHKHHLDGRCPNEFETSYSSERKEIVYCEQCYNAEVV
ncbi:hypothetical protein HY967_04585 [Candidatus Jorgensenbacteria bacterium]|nr:hypothetical protein [Candidatus Jorgensenbacteria bacterium]